MGFAAAGQLIRNVRQAQGLTQRRLAARAGIDHTYLSKIETGTLEYAPKPDLLKALAQQLGLSQTEQTKLKQHYGQEQVTDWLPSSALLPDYAG